MRERGSRYRRRRWWRKETLKTWEMTLLALLLVLVHAPQKQGFKHQKYGEVTGNIAKWSREERQGRKGNNTKGQLCCEQLELSSLGNTDNQHKAHSFRVSASDTNHELEATGGVMQN